MRLINFQIKNIKSIIDSGKCHLSDTDNVTIFAGQNEAGKSAILEALNFFGNTADEKFIRLSKRLNAHPYVVCEFSIDNADKNSENPDVNTVLEDLKTVTAFSGNESADEFDSIDLSEQSREEIKKLVQKFEGKKTKKIEEKTPAEETAGEPNTEPKTTEDDGLFEQVVNFILDNLPTFIFYDSFTGLLPGEINVSEIANNQAAQDFEKIFNVNFSEAISKNAQERSAIIDAVTKKAELDLNTYWTQRRTTTEDDKYRFDINLIPNGEASKVEFLIHRDDGTPLFMEQKSKGFQWFNAFNLRLKALGVEKEDLSGYILLIDEPGQGLHEKAQSDVKGVLEELARKGMQIIYTTHNPSLIGVNDEELLRIRLVFQDKNNGTKINTITQFASNNQDASKDALSPIITAMGISHFGQLLDTSKRCVVLEGITDHYYLTAFKKLLEVNAEYAFIPACGVKNVRPLVSILIGWGADFKAVFDDGKEGKSVYNDLNKNLFKENDEGFKKAVKKLDSYEGIEDLFDKDDFNNSVVGDKPQNSNQKNSEFIKTKKKELIARLFLEKVNSGQIKKETLKQSTLDNFKSIFEWLKL